MNHVFDCGTSDEINNHFAAVATDSEYNKNSILTKMNDHISKFDTTKACDVYNILLTKSQLFCLVLQKQPLDLTVFHTGYLKNVLENSVTSFLC